MSFADREWMTRASCRGKRPEIFAPESQGVGQLNLIDEAIAICQHCPVINECRRYADNPKITYGVWGGQWINRTKNASYEAVDSFPHGTEAGHKRHVRRGEQPCQQCRDGETWARRERKRRKDQAS